MVLAKKKNGTWAISDLQFADKWAISHISINERWALLNMDVTTTKGRMGQSPVGSRNRRS